MQGTYVRTQHGPYLVLDVSAGSVSGLHAPAFSGQGAPEAGVVIDGVFGHGVVNVDISSRQLGSTLYPFFIGPVDLSHARLTHSEVGTIFVHPEARLRGVQVQDRETGWRSIDQVPASAHP
jgi:hypothetical protein